MRARFVGAGIESARRAQAENRNPRAHFFPPGLLSSGQAPAPPAFTQQSSRVRVRSTIKEYGLPLVLLAASVVTTTANGARFMQNFAAGLPPVARDGDLWPWGWLWAHPANFQSGWPFSATLLGILLVHEFGHYFACRWHSIGATLPWVLPAPTLSGTAGAVIQIRGRIPSRNALMDVGIFGPLAGYLASAIAVAVGFALSLNAPLNAPAAIVEFGREPLTLRLVHALLAHWIPSIPDFEHSTPHPVLIAGWIGLFITSLNLIPGGQLDGGHILYAVSPRAHKIFTRALPVLLFLMGVVYWVGWMLWGIFLLIPFMRHPKVSIEPQLNRSRVVLAFIGLAIFLLTFTPTPFYNNSLLHFFNVDLFRAAT
jgi:membrane-associated protease RseP (regulator of RpoE activity)